MKVPRAEYLCAEKYLLLMKYKKWGVIYLVILLHNYPWKGSEDTDFICSI